MKSPLALALEEIKELPARTLRVTLECAGNGRAAMSPRYPSMPWAYEAVGTAEWTGTPLRHLLDRAGLLDDVVEIAIIGADRGFDRGHEHAYGRSLAREVALGDDILARLGHERGAAAAAARLSLAACRARVVRHGQREVAHRIEALAQPYEGFQQVHSYMYRSVPGGPTTPVTHMRVKSLLVPPGIPDFYTRQRMVEAGPVTLYGRAWSGAGVAIARVEVGIDGAWHQAELEPPRGKFAWRGWRCSVGCKGRRAPAVLPRHRRQRRETAAGAALGHRRLRQQRRATRAGDGEIGGMDSTIEVSLWRGKADGRYQTYAVPLRENQTVLDVVTWVQRHADPTLAYRFACRVGMCGSCAMTVNGRPRWTCRTHISKVVEDGRLEIGPLANMAVIKDLACDMAAFFEKWQKAKGAFAPSKSRHEPIERIAPASAPRIAADAAVECINCGGVLFGLRHGALERGLSGPRRPQPRLDARQRRARRRQRRAARRGGGQRRLPCLPFAPELPGALPQGAQPHRLHRRPETAHHAGVYPGGAVMRCAASAT